MKFAVIAANGKSGQAIVKEAVERGHDVTVFVRGENKTVAAKAVRKDILAITSGDLAGFDAVIDAFGVWEPARMDEHTVTSQHLCDALSGTGTRLLIVGGAGSLYVNPEHTMSVYQTPEFPAEYLPVATAQAKELEELRKRTDVKWTFVSPAGEFVPDGERTGKYIQAGEEFTLNSRGESIISYADYAIAMVDEAEKGAHPCQRISVVRA